MTSLNLPLVKLGGIRFLWAVFKEALLVEVSYCKFAVSSKASVSKKFYKIFY